MVSMKKHRYKTILSVFFALLLILSTVSLAVYAAEASALSAELITDKEEYAESEDISVTLRIKNTGENKLSDIAYSLTAPDGYRLKSGSLKGTEDELRAGGTLSYDNVFSAVVAVPEEPGNSDKPASPDTGVTVNPVIPLITAVVCAVALLILNKKKAKNLMALVLCASLLSSALPLDVAADEIKADISRSADITVTKDVTAGGVKKTFTARVTAGEYGGNVTVTYDAQGGKEIDSLTLPVGETVGRLPDTVKEGAVHNGWYLDKECTEQFYEDEPVMQDMTLYAGYDEDGIKPETPDYNEITISDAPEDFSFSLVSQSGITSENLQDIISIECEYGDMPQFDVENTASGTYTVKPSEGWTAGGAYVLNLIDNNVRFSGINSDILPDDRIKTITLFIYREETNNVKLKDGIITIPSGRITEDEDSEYIRISKDEFETLGIENGTVIFSDNAQDSEKSRYMNVISYELVGDEYKILVESSDVDDIYDELDIYFSEKYVDNEVLAESVDTEELVAKLYDGEGTQQLTYMLAAALYDSKTVRELGDGNAPFELMSNTYMDGVDWNDKQIKLNIKELLEGLTISAKVGTAKNSNFSFINGFPNEQDWTALNITFSYEVTLKNKVKLDAEVAISEYFIIGVGGSVNSKRDFNAKFLPLSQTDVSFKILVSSADEEEDGNGNNNNSEENKRDVSVEIEAILNGEDKDSSNIIKDVQEMLDSKGGAIRLCEVNLFSATFMPIFPLSVKMELNFVVNVSFAAGISMEASVLQAKGIGIRGNIKNPSSINVYRFIMAGDDRYIFDMYAYGYLGVEAGIEGKVSVSLLGLNDLGSVGAALEIGAYADLYGYLHYHSQDMRMNKYYASPKENYSDLQGGIYFEMGIYIKISVFAESKLFNKKAELAKQFKFPLFGVGDKYIYADKPTLDGNTDIILRETDTNVYEIDGLIPAQGTYLDITTGDVVTRQMNSNEFKAACYSKYFKVTKNDSGRITLTVSPDAPSKYTSGLLSCILRVYYTGGQNLLFTSDTEKLYYDADKGTYVSRKYIGDVNVYYYRNGVDFPLEDKDKTATLKFAVSADGKTETVDTVTVQKGGYVSGFSLAVANYCNSNGYIYDTSLFDTEIKPYYWLRRCLINYDVYIYNEHGAEVSHEIKAEFEGYRPEYDELCKKYDAEVAALTSYEDEYYTYTLKEEPVNDENTTDDGKTYKTIIVRWNRTPKEFDVTFDYDNGTENETVKVKYGYLYRATAGALKDDKFNDYELVGFDLDGNGTADVMPGESFRVTGDMTLKAVWKATDKIYSVVFYAMSGEFDDGTVRYEITGKYGDTVSQSDIPVPTAPEGYEFAGWDKAVPTTFGNDDGIIKTEIKATYKLKKMTITYRLVNLDTNKVYESYKTAEFDYGTVFTADMLEASPDTDGCLFGGWLGENGYSVIGKEIKSDMTLTGTITPVYVIYSLDGVESSREKAKIGSEVTVKEKSDGYLDWTTEDVTVASGKFTMPSKNVAFTAEKDLSGYLTVSDGSASSVIDTESKTFISNKASGFEYDTATGILTVTGNGLKLSGVGKNIMLYIKQSVSDITFENLTLTAGDMNGAKPDDFGNSGSIGDEQGSADTYLMFVSSNSLKVNVNGNVTLSKRNTATTANLLAIYQSHLDYTDATPMSMEFVGGDSSNFTVTGNTYAIQSVSSVKFSNMTFTAAAEYYGVHAETIRFDRCSIITTGLAGTNIESSTGIYSNDLSIVDCSLDIRTGIFGETIDISGATDGKVTSGYGGAVMVKCKTAGWSETASGLLTVALDKGHSVLFTVSAGNSAIQAYDFEGGENKVVSYPQTTVPDKEFELTKDFYWLLKEKNGSALINEITFSGK